MSEVTVTTAVETKSKKVAQIFSDPFASVDVQPVQVAGENIASKCAVRVKADDGTWSLVPSILSSGYNVIHNTVLRDFGSDVMSRSGHEWNPLKRHWDGKRFVDMWITRDAVTQVDGGYPIHLGMSLRNSYDGSGLLGAEMFACNMVCSNQFLNRNRFGYFAFRHTGKESFDIQDALQNLGSGLQKVIDVAPRLNGMRKTDLTVRHIIDAKKNTEITHPRWADVLDQLDKEPDAGTLFGLYQAMTFVASHVTGGLTSLRVGDSIGNYMLE